MKLFKFCGSSFTSNNGAKSFLMMMFMYMMPMCVFACLYVTKNEHFLELSVFLFVCYVLSFLWPSDDDDEDEAGDGARD